MIVFDDQFKAFYPITLVRSVGDLRCGVLKLRQRLQNLLEDDDNSVWIEPRLQDLYLQRHPDWKINQQVPADTLCVNSRLVVTDASIMAIRHLQKGEYLASGSSLIAFRSSECTSSLPSLEDLFSTPHTLVSADIKLYENLSDIIHDNDRLLRFDFDHFFYEKDNYFETEPGVTTLHPYNIWIGENVNLKPGVILDASDGPIVVDEGVKIMHNAVIIGPAYIGKNTTIKVGAKIYGSTSIGPICKIGGEVEGSIFQAYSNKQHDGFLGHSYVGEWVNIGADTNNSDLKNTYKNVGFYSYEQHQKIDSGSMFLGAIIADHVKLGINTSINTGCVIGVGSNLWGSDLISDFIPDFSWGMAMQLSKYRFEAFCATAQLVKLRRNLTLTDIETRLYRNIFADLIPQS